MTTKEVERVQVISERKNGSPPECFIHNESDRPNLDPPLGTIPIIDFSYVESKDLDQRCLEDSKLRSASSNWGIFQVVGHGIPTSYMEEIRNIQRLFFKQSIEEKQKYAIDWTIPEYTEGYGSDVVLSDDQILNWNDKLHLNVYPEKVRNMDRWPRKPETFKEKILEFDEKVMIIMDEIFKSLARSLGLDEFYFINNGTKGRTMWRFNYYPSCSKPDLVLGLKIHTDATFLTILLLDDKVPGLQVFNDEFGWVKVPIRPDALVVVLGDEIQIMSNGVYKSVIHKVVTNSEQERISLAIFVLSEPEKEIGPIDELIEEGEPRLYRKIMAKRFLEHAFSNYSKGKPHIDDFMKV
ncbi:hypothetical protein ZOSMA_91G00930 [Zostera marina]|uniref:Fe2OG dioxygenase domain-containing protein n=1 Tax=Zostera marina TaxID=29655 RepID=A0A0K9NJ77_ZOSMR|nr:hypothetical protein ZOSMA_91G00930 [Zostera marina]